MKCLVVCAFVSCWLVANVPAAAGCWRDIDPISFAQQCPVIVRGTITRIEPGQAVGDERIYDTAVIAIDKVFTNTLGDEPTVKDGGLVRVKMVSTRNKLRMSTDLSYKVGTSGIWLINLRPDAQLHIDLHPVQRQPLDKEDVLRRGGAFRGEMEKVHSKATKPPPAPTKAEVLARRKEREQKDRERAKTHEALQKRVLDLADSLASAPRLGKEQFQRFDGEPERVRLDLFNLGRDKVNLTGPNRLALCMHILQCDPADNVRTFAAGWLDGNEVRQAALLRQALKDRSEFVRSTACGRLHDCREPGTGRLLAGLLDDKSWWVRMAAVDALGRLGDRTQAPAVLVLCAREGDKEDNAYHFAEALARLGETDASLRCVRTCMLSDNENIRHFGVLALGQNRSEKVVTTTMSFLAPELKRTVAELQRGASQARIFAGLCEQLRQRTGQKIGNDVPAWHDWWASARGRYQGPEFVIDRLAVRALQDKFRKLTP